MSAFMFIGLICLIAALFGLCVFMICMCIWRLRFRPEIQDWAIGIFGIMFFLGGAMLCVSATFDIVKRLP